MDRKELKAWLESQSWTWSKTYAKKAPHYWICKEDIESFAGWSLFEDAVIAIREFGEDTYFWKKKYRTIDIGEWRYWTMGAPIMETIIINRCYADYDKRMKDRGPY